MMDPELLAVFKLPFKEQETFFQNKLNIPTGRWDDLWKDQHAKGFMVAGAYKTDILTDFRAAVDKAIAGGVSLESFRKDFDGIVARHGWSYNGARNWRSEVIYSTNVRQSYNAGRWAQLTDPEQLQALPYLTYRHGDSRVPRPHHLAWDGTTLPADDPWWDTHYPQNGWGCKCRVHGSTRKEYETARRAGKGEAPPSPPDPKTGEPVGIDKGFGNNVGKAGMEQGYGVLTGKFETLPYDVARKWISSYVNEPAFERFIEGKIGGEFPVAVLNDRFLREIGGLSQAVWMSDETLAKNRAAHGDLTLHDYRRLPDIIENAQTVIRDGGQTMVFIRIDGRIYHAVVKSTKSGGRDYMTSLRLTDMEDLERMRRRGEVLKDEL